MAGVLRFTVRAEVVTVIEMMLTCSEKYDIIYELLSYACVAQLVEQLICNKAPIKNYDMKFLKAIRL